MKYNEQYQPDPKLSPKHPVRISLTYEQMQATANLLWDFYIAIDEVKKVRERLDLLRTTGRNLLCKLDFSMTPQQHINTIAELSGLLETNTTPFLPLESYPEEANRLHREVHDTMVNCFLSMERPT